MLIVKGTNILLSNGSLKKIEYIDKDLIVDYNGNISNLKISKCKGQIFKYKISNGLEICGNIKFLTLNKDNIKRPSSDIKTAQIINSYVDKNYYLISKNIKKESNFKLPKDIIFFIGLFISNGRYLYKNNKIFGASIYCHDKLKIFNILKQYFPCASITKKEDLICVSGKEIISFLKRNIIGDQKHRRVSQEVFWMNKDLQLELLKGWFYNKGIDMNSNCLIGCLRSKHIVSLLAFSLTRNGIPYTIAKNVNYRFVISGSFANKLNMNFVENKNKKFKYRNFNNDILFRIKDVENLGLQDCFYIKDDVGLIANNYAIGGNNKNIEIVSKCSCNKKIILFENNICSECQLKELQKQSWRNGIKCKRCKKKVESKRGSKKFCSDVCRRLYYNPLEEQNKATNYIGYVNKGYISYPQKFIYNFVIEKYSNYNWTYNNRTIIRNPNTNYPLELDVWCKELKFAIEFDGAQHFKDKDLKYTKKLDKIKNKLCEEKGIKLLRINYKNNWKNKEWLSKKIGEFMNS